LHTIHNAAIQLLATLLNNAPLAFIAVAFIAPVASGHLDLGWHIVTILALVGVGVSLHFGAWAVLGRLR
jgi:hypothetical protein